MLHIVSPSTKCRHRLLRKHCRLRPRTPSCRACRPARSALLRQQRARLSACDSTSGGQNDAGKPKASSTSRSMLCPPHRAAACRRHRSNPYAARRSADSAHNPSAAGTSSPARRLPAHARAPTGSSAA